MSVDIHLEKHLGLIARGWEFPDGPEGVSAVVFDDQPFLGVTTLATLGLSHHILHLGEKQVRQELLFGFHGGHSDHVLARLLVYLSEVILKNHCAIVRGELIPLGRSIVRGSKVQHMYACAPSVHPEGLDVCETTTPPTVIVWLIPVLPSEVEWINTKGWNSFEDLLEQRNPDLFDLMRDPIF